MRSERAMWQAMVCGVVAGVMCGGVVAEQIDESYEDEPGQSEGARDEISDAELKRLADELAKESEGLADRREPIHPDGIVHWDDPVAGQPRVLPEGTFLAKRAGRVVRAESGELVFVMAKSAGEEGAGEVKTTGERAGQGGEGGAMVLLPGRTLMMVDKAAERYGDGTAVVLSGRVTAYHGRNYLLPVGEVEVVRQVAEDETGNETAGEESDTQRPGQPSVEGNVSGDPEVEALLAELGQHAGRTGLGRQQEAEELGGDEAAGVGGGSWTLAESLITQRSGRVVRAGGGGWLFVTDNDLDGAVGWREAGVRLQILPSVNLEGIEAIAQKDGDRVTFNISGEVTQFYGRNYLLVTMWQVNRMRGEIASGQ